jgi:hypothetical protein
MTSWRQELLFLSDFQVFSKIFTPAERYIEPFILEEKSSFPDGQSEPRK